MAVSLAIWSQDLEPNKRNIYTVENDVRISGASLPAQLKDNSGRTVVEVVVKMSDEMKEDLGEALDDDSGEKLVHKFVLCSLTPGKVEQQPLDIILPEGEDIEFVVTGKNPIHLYGNYISQGDSSDNSEGEDDEDEFDLDDIPSDVEVESDDLGDDSGRFEEIEEPAVSVKPIKRPREDEETADLSIATGPDTSTLSKKEKKRAKKLKNEAGKAVPAPASTPVAAATVTVTTAATPTNGKTIKPDEEKKDGEKGGKKAGENQDTKKSEQKKDGKKDGDKKKKSETRTLPGGVAIQDVKVGTGPSAKNGKKIGMRYIGKLKNGKVFDSNTKGKPFFFTLGAGDVIKGWDEGIQGMNVGGERVLTIPAAKGYGKRGAPPDIPPNAELIFEVKLVEVK